MVFLVSEDILSSMMRVKERAKLSDTFNAQPLAPHGLQFCCLATDTIAGRWC